MIEVQEDRTSDIVTIKASGEITQSDIEAAVPQLERLIEERSPLRLYVELIGLDRFKSAGLWQELKFDVRHRDDVARVAFLVDSPGEEWTATLGGLLLGAESRQFHPGERPWRSTGCGSDPGGAADRFTAKPNRRIFRTAELADCTLTWAAPRPSFPNFSSAALLARSGASASRVSIGSTCASVVRGGLIDAQN